VFFQHHQTREPQLGVARPSGIVEVDHVVVSHPNRHQAHVAWAAQAELQPAWPASASQSNVSHRELVGQQVLFRAKGLVNELAQLGQRVEERNTTPLVVSSFEIAEKSLTRWEGLVVGYFEIVGKKLQITSQVQSRIAPLLSQVRKASGRLPRGHLPES